MVPRHIFVLWLQGERSAPPLVQMCLRRWRRLNPDWDVRVLDRSDVARLLEDSPVTARSVQAQALSDVVRIKLLAEHGGVWVDATAFPTAPLDTWLPAAASSGFFAFRGHRRPLAVDSWFLAADRDHLVPRLWWEEAERYWSRRRTLVEFARNDLWDMNYHLDPLSFFDPADRATADVYPYYWLMFLFAHLLHTRPDVAEAWAQVPVVAGHDAHAVQHLNLADRDVADADLVAAAMRAGVQVQKLSYKSRLAHRWQRLDSAFEQVDRAHGVSFEDVPVFVPSSERASRLAPAAAVARERLRRARLAALRELTGG